MDYSVLEKCSLFAGIPAHDLEQKLKKTPHHMQCYDKDEVIFHLMEPADRIGIILDGSVEAQKPFPNGSQINVSVRVTGTLIGPAAAFSSDRIYPCDIVAIEPATVLMIRKDDLLRMMQEDIRILTNFTTEIATAAYMLQNRLELMSYSGIAQKAACWLLMQSRRTGTKKIRIPGSVSKWAMLMNVSRPSLHRELKRLDEQGIIRYELPVIEILDADSLEEVLSK